MLSYEDALRRVLEGVTPLPSERIALGEANGRVLAQDLVAGRPIPEFDYSAMDGYAVASNNFLGNGPWTLSLRGESRAGSPLERLAHGTACRIFTGAEVPPGADTVVAQEDTTRSGESVAFAAKPSAGAHVRRVGEDIKAGALALVGGTRLNPYRLGLLAALHCSTLNVARRPRVTVVCTGDELTLPGESGPRGTIAESNGIVLRALAEAAGARAELAPIARDRQSSLEQLFLELLPTTDLLVTVGGVSVGDYDVVQAALRDAGGSVDFWKVALKPGKPLLYGHRGATRVLGLPGNPASAQVTFTLFGMPLLRKLQGDRSPELPFRKLALAAALRQRPGRRGFYAFTFDGDAAKPLVNQASGATTGTAWADGLLTLPADSEGAAAGATVDAISFRELGV